MNKWVVLIALFVIGIIAVATVFLLKPSSSQTTSLKTGKAKVRIGFSLGALREERWQKDIDLFTQRAEELGATVQVEYASEDANLQTSQAENLISQGVNVLVVVAHDADTAATIVEKAHAAGIKVIAYDRMINKSNPDLFITFDSRRIGELEAQEITRRVPKGTYAYIGGATTDGNSFLHKEGTMKVLDPLIKKGDITVGLDKFTTDWRPEEAYKNMKAYLAQHKKVDAVIAANDGTAGGVIQALKEVGLAGKVPVGGSDADLAAVQRIVEGTQASTMYTPFKLQAFGAADAAVAFAKGQKPKVNGTLSNGTTDVQSYFLEPILVTKENVDATVIAGGLHKREDVYQNVQSTNK